MNQGWIKSWRKTIESEVFADANLFRTWFYVLHRATHKSTTVSVQGEKVKLKPGQMATSARLLAEQLGIGKTPQTTT